MKTKDFDGEQLFNSVGEVKRNFEIAGEQAGAERWCTNSERRGQLFNLVRASYCRMTGCKKYNFPFSEDGVVLAYLRYRKDSSKKKAKEELFA